MNRRSLLGILLATVLSTVFLFCACSFLAVGLFYHFFYLRYDTYCPTDLTVADLHETAVPVTFSSDGTDLSGLFIGDGTNGVIVMVHGMRSGMDAHFAEADYFAAHGYTVFAFDGRGTRTSGGSSRDSISAARDDLDAALDYLESSAYGSLPVYLYGHSSGGYAAATELERADAAVVLSAFDDPIEVMCSFAGRYAGFFAYSQKPFLALWNRFHAGSDANERADEVIDRTDVPILIVSGSDDSVIPPDLSVATAVSESDPNVSCLEWRGGHSGLWLCDDALAYRETVKDADPKTVDRLRYNAVDPVFLDMVLAFFAAS